MSRALPSTVTARPVVPTFSTLPTSLNVPVPVKVSVSMPAEPSFEASAAVEVETWRICGSAGSVVVGVGVGVGVGTGAGVRVPVATSADPAGAATLLTKMNCSGCRSAILIPSEKTAWSASRRSITPSARS